MNGIWKLAPIFRIGIRTCGDAKTISFGRINGQIIFVRCMYVFPNLYNIAINPQAVVATQYRVRNCQIMWNIKFKKIW